MPQYETEYQLKGSHSLPLSFTLSVPPSQGNIFAVSYFLDKTGVIGDDP